MMHFSSDPKIAELEMHALITYLVAFGYADGHFDKAEKAFIKEYVGKLVHHRASDALADADAGTVKEVVEKWSAHFGEVVDSVDAEIRENLLEPVSENEDQESYALTRLKLRTFELFRRFDEDARKAMLATAAELIVADGKTDPREEKLRVELEALLETPTDFDEGDIETIEKGGVVIDAEKKLAPRADNHPFFSRSEWGYAKDTETFVKQAEGDVDLVRRVMQKFEEQRMTGRGKLKLGTTFRDFAGDAPFVDQHVIVYPPRGKDCELLVLGDLHGCYSCLKAALMQADFFAKVQAYHDDPEKNPNMILVLLGDYIDRGRFSYSGVLRTLMELFLVVPDHVVLLRGNHEYYVELNGRVYGAVKPSEAYTEIKTVAPNEDVLVAFMRFFESMPTSFVFDNLFFVHAGIPRDDTFAEKWQGLESLNDFDLRFQMLWSDPSQADVVPLELQKQSARFAFGKKQFRAFMHKIGCSTMIRGHERVVEGFKEIYPEPDARLLNLFSAGGKNNDDLPFDSNYRDVTPKALTIKHQGEINHLAPFEIDYERYNDPATNAFFKNSIAPGR